MLALGVLMFLLVFFIPRFQGIFAGSAPRCRCRPRSSIGVSNVVRSYGLFVLVGLVVAGCPAADLVHLGEGPADVGGLDAALAGRRAAGGASSPWRGSAGCWARCSGAGVPLVQGLNVARKSIGNQILVDAVSQSIERVQQGGQLGASLAEMPRRCFPARCWK